MNVNYFTKRAEKLERIWFIDKVFAIGGYEASYPFRTTLTIYVRPKYGTELINFYVKKCPITGDFGIKGTLDKMDKHFNIYRRIYWNVKTFFAYIKTIL